MKRQSRLMSHLQLKELEKIPKHFHLWVSFWGLTWLQQDPQLEGSDCHIFSLSTGLRRGPDFGTYPKKTLNMSEQFLTHNHVTLVSIDVNIPFRSNEHVAMQDTMLIYVENLDLCSRGDERPRRSERGYIFRYHST